MKKNNLLYIMNPQCGWCKKADPLVADMRKNGHSITTLDVNNQEDAKRASEVKNKHNVQCGTPLFIDAESGNAVCGFREMDVLEKWAKGEKIPAPPQRTPPQAPQNVPNSISDVLDFHKFRLEVWQEAKQALSECFYFRKQIWQETDCLEEMPVYPTNEQIRKEADKIYNFIQNRG
jgi:uncharacterized Zn finger protein (UPF0148 family)